MLGSLLVIRAIIAGQVPGDSGMKFFSILALALIAECVSASPIQPIGHGRYIVTGRFSGWQLSGILSA